MITSQPPFWLTVKKEYVIDNFEQMLKYLSKYQYLENESNDDYDSTFNTLKSVVYDYLAETDNDAIYDDSTRRWDDPNKVIRLIATYLLASLTKKQTDIDVLLRLADILLRTRQIKGSSLRQEMKRIILACLKGKKVNKFGFSWPLLASASDFSIAIFCERFCTTDFYLPPGANADTTYYAEGHGTLIVDKKLILTDLSLADWRRKRVETIFELPGELEVASLPDKSDLREYAALRTFCRNFLMTQQAMRPSDSAPKGKKEYEEGDELIVRITKCNTLGGPYNIYDARSVDPQYKRVAGKVFCKSDIFGIESEMIRDCYDGDYLRVAYQKESPFVPFTLVPTFTKAYVHLAETSPREQYAVYYDSYSAGHQWLTEYGLRVNIMGKLTPDAMAALDKQSRIKVRINSVVRDRNDNYVVNGFYLDYDTSAELDDYDEFVEEAKLACLNNLGDAFITEYAEEEPEQDFLPIPSNFYPTLLARLYYFIAQELINSIERCQCLFAAESLAGISAADDSRDLLFIRHERAYRDCLMRFAMHASGQELRLAHAPELDGVREVELKERLVGKLREHREERTQIDLLLGRSQEELFSLVSDLVDASNVLLGKISNTEINRIKKNIARYLRVEDAYKNIFTELTCYGDESDTLEFKTSVVYVPNAADQAEPNRQMLNIIKAVCGFLNTQAGGDLLLGVDDSGLPVGLRRDIDYLYANKLISDPSLDKLRLYVKYHLDHAFVDDKQNAGLDIAATRINYYIERADSGTEILRIRVLPYEYGIVSFCGEVRNVVGEKQAFYRTSGATNKMTAAMKRQVAEMKLKSSFADERDAVLNLQKAIEAKRVVRFKSYQGERGVADCDVEVYKLLLGRGLAVGFDRRLGENRVFKLSRCAGVEVLATTPWSNSRRHASVNIDVFDCLQQSGKARFELPVELKLSHTALTLLLEEYPSAAEACLPNLEDDSFEYPRTLRTTVYSLEGIGRFYVGLARQIKIVSGEELKAWAADYARLLTGEA